MTMQYNALHHNMAQHILLKPVIPSPHPIFRNDPSPSPSKYRNKLWQSSGYTKQKSSMSCKTVLILPSHRPAIQGDEIESEILKTLVSVGTVGKHVSENSPGVRRVYSNSIIGFHFLKCKVSLPFFRVMVCSILCVYISYVMF